MKKDYFLSLFVLMILSVAVPASALATGQSDIVAGLKTLPLLTNKISGDTTMAIVYDPAVTVSLEDARRVQKLVDEGIKIPGGGKLTGLMISVGELGKLARAQIAFMTPGLAAHYADISIATSSASILTITTDLGCVRAAKCIIGVSTEPSVTIYYSKSAADAAKLEFTAAFGMLVKEL